MRPIDKMAFGRRKAIFRTLVRASRLLLHNGLRETGPREMAFSNT